MIDVSDPLNPVEVASADRSGWVYDVEVNGSYVYSASIYLGVLIDRVVIPGDMNCDGRINAFDIDPFVLAMVSASQEPPFSSYLAEFPNCDGRRADCNGDGAVDAFDIDPFVEILVSRSR